MSAGMAKSGSAAGGGPWRKNVLLPGQLAKRAPCGGAERIRFRDTVKDLPEDAMDLSREGNGSVMAFIRDEAEGVTLTVCGEGGVAAPEDCGSLFAGMKLLRSIDFGGCFHTEEARRMRCLFDSCQFLRSLDLSGFDTAKVTDMRCMFYGCRSLRALDLSSFDTARVTDMSGMFTACSRLETLEVGSFDTARVTNMKGMFFGCSAIRTLDVRSFRTAGVRDMSLMFAFCGAQTGWTPDLRGFTVAGDCLTGGMLEGVSDRKG